MRTCADMKDIGGFFELERPGEPTYCHPNAVRLNAGRSGLGYLARAHGITRIYVPAYTCPAVWRALEAEGCEISFYEIGPDFMPVSRLPEDEWIVFNNYFGVCARQAERMIAVYPRLILDNAQAYYALAGENAIYSPRKFFGVPDGGELVTSRRMDEPLETDSSLERVSHLFRRIELGSGAAYSDFQRAEAMLDGAPVRRMSRLTEQMLGGVEHKRIARVRRENFTRLHAALGERNALTLSLRGDEVPLVYPLLDTARGEALKARLIENHIYVATYWPEQRSEGFGRELQKNLLALPIDQRYDAGDMDRILEVLYG